MARSQIGEGQASTDCATAAGIASTHHTAGCIPNRVQTDDWITPYIEYLRILVDLKSAAGAKCTGPECCCVEWRFRQRSQTGINHISAGTVTAC